MQKLKKHNFSNGLDTQNALTERHVADEIKKQKVLRQLEVFIQNRLSRHMPYNTMDKSTTEKRRHMTLTCLGKSKFIL